MTGTVWQVWVVPTLKGDGAIYWAADSDSALTKVCHLTCSLNGATGLSAEQLNACVLGLMHRDQAQTLRSPRSAT